MSHARFASGSGLTTDGDMWVLGGVGIHKPITTSMTSDIIDIKKGQSLKGPDLPAIFLGHCVANFNATHVFVGSGNSLDQKAAWLVDTTTFTFNRLPNMKSDRLGAACGAVHSSNEGGSQAILMAGGITEDNIVHRTSELYFPDGDYWMDGPDLPREFAWGGFASQDGDLILAGGTDSSGKMHDDVITFQVHNFATLPVKMKTARIQFSMVATSDDEDCQ